MDPYEEHIVPNLKEYRGKWVAVANGRVIAVNKNPKVVMRKLKDEDLTEPPFVTRVLEENFALY